MLTHAFPWCHHVVQDGMVALSLLAIANGWLDVDILLGIPDNLDAHEILTEEAMHVKLHDTRVLLVPFFSLFLYGACAGGGAGLVAACMRAPVLVQLGKLALPMYLFQQCFTNGSNLGCSLLLLGFFLFFGMLGSLNFSFQDG